MQIRKVDSKFYQNLEVKKAKYGFAFDCGHLTPDKKGEFHMDFTGTGFFLADLWTTVSTTQIWNQGRQFLFRSGGDESAKRV